MKADADPVSASVLPFAAGRAAAEPEEFAGPDDGVLGADPGGRKVEMLERYAAALLRRNAVVNLTSARTRAAVDVHIADSVSIAGFLREPFVDVGSGGGFPAIPLAIVTGFRGTLIEAVQKKARFLAEVVEDLGLPLDVRAMRAEDAGRDANLRAHFASATARAVSSLPTVLELTVPFLCVDGVAVLQRGRMDPRERAAATDASLVLGAVFEDERRLGDDEADERRTVIVRKVAATNGRFPRRAGIPAKRPLCQGGEDFA